MPQEVAARVRVRVGVGACAPPLQPGTPMPQEVAVRVRVRVRDGVSSCSSVRRCPRTSLFGLGLGLGYGFG